MTISEKVAYLKGLAEGLNLDTEKSKEGKLISVMIGILEEIGLSIEDLEENAQALGEEIDVLSDDLADVESEVFGEDEDEDGEADFDTVGGLIIDRLGRIPAAGEDVTLEYGGLEFTVLEVEDRRVGKVKCTRAPELNPENDDDEEEDA